MAAAARNTGHTAAPARAEQGQRPPERESPALHPANQKAETTSPIGMRIASGSLTNSNCPAAPPFWQQPIRGLGETHRSRPSRPRGLGRAPVPAAMAASRLAHSGPAGGGSPGRGVVLAQGQGQCHITPTSASQFSAAESLGKVWKVSALPPDTAGSGLWRSSRERGCE